MAQLKASIIIKHLKKVEEQNRILEIEIWNKNKAFLNELPDTPTPCVWKSIKGKSVHAKGKMIRVTSNLNGKMTKRSRELPAVTPLPPNDMWIFTPINFMSPDAKELAFIPYLGLNGGYFTQELINEHRGHLRENKSHFLIDDNVIVDLVEALKHQIKRQTNVLEKTLKNQVVLPESIIFQSILTHISPCISHDTTVEELQEKYLKLTGKHSECTQNVDGPMTIALTRERALHSYHKWFCRRCCMYNCNLHLHNLENRNSQRNFPVRKLPGLKPLQEACSEACYMLKVKGSSNEQNNNEEVQVCRSAHSTEWTATDQTMFLSLHEVFPENCCTIARIMLTKSCQEVYKYQDERIKSSDIQPVTGTIRKKRMVNKRNKPSAYKNKHNEGPYIPCDHKGLAIIVNCSKRVGICRCKTGCNTSKCFCYSARRECSETCKCEACKNNALQRRLSKKLEILPSKVHGWGVYVQEICQEDELINEYRGEIISVEEADQRGKVYDRIGRTYMFELNNRYVVDGARFGSEIRFANFSKFPNCIAKIMMVNGDHRIGIYAKRIIEKGEELTFDYHSFNPTVETEC